MAIPLEMYPSADELWQAKQAQSRESLQTIDEAGGRARQIMEEGRVPLLTNIPGHEEPDTVYIPQEVMSTAYPGKKVDFEKQYAAEQEIKNREKEIAGISAKEPISRSYVEKVNFHQANLIKQIGIDPRSIDPEAEKQKTIKEWKNNNPLDDKGATKAGNEAYKYAEQHKYLLTKMIFDNATRIAKMEVEQEQKKNTEEDKLSSRDRAKVSSINTDIKTLTGELKDVPPTGKYLARHNEIKKQIESLKAERDSIISGKKESSATEFKTAESVRDAYKNGKLSKEEAKNILTKQFGYK